MIGKPLGKEEVKATVANGPSPISLGRMISGTPSNPIPRGGEKMNTQEIAHRNFAELENMFAGLANDGREPSLLLAARNADAALARAQEDAAIEAQDVLSQANEALVLG